MPRRHLYVKALPHKSWIQVTSRLVSSRSISLKTTYIITWKNLCQVFELAIEILMLRITTVKNLSHWKARKHIPGGFADNLKDFLESISFTWTKRSLTSKSFQLAMLSENVTYLSNLTFTHQLLLYLGLERGSAQPNLFQLNFS